MYVLTYDEQSRQRAEQEFGKHAWARVVTLRQGPHTKYMEGAAFLDLLPARREEWKDASFVGTLSWRASEKIHIPDTLEQVLQDVQGSDVVTLLPSTERLLQQAVRSHPRFLECWLPLMARLGIEPAAAACPNTACFFCNYWLATPAWMDRWLAWFARAVEVLETAPELQDALWDKAGYSNSLPTERLLEIYNTPYFPLVPFLTERLAPFFFSHAQAIITALPLGRREFWHAYYKWELEDTGTRAARCADTLDMLGRDDQAAL